MLHSLHALEEARGSFGRLSPIAACFLDYLVEKPERIEQLKRVADDLPPWTRPYKTTQLTWPTFVGPEKLRQIKRATENVCSLVKSLPDRVFKGDPKKISDFYHYADASLVELLMLQPNGIKGAVGRCDFVDGPAGFKCCEINMAANIGGWRSRFWTEKYLANPVVSEFISNVGIQAFHHDPLGTFCVHVVDDAKTSGVCTDGTLNVVMVCPPHSVPGSEGRCLAQAIYGDLLRVANAGVSGTVLFCSQVANFQMKNGCLFHENQRIHAVVNYAGTILPKQVYWSQKAGTICLYNGSLTKIMSDKRNLALLSELEHTDLFDDAERQVIRDHIPWSRIVVDGKTTYHEESVLLPHFLISARDRLVLKLGIGFGGRDVNVGKFTPADEWNERVRIALADGGWIVQEYLESHPYIFADGEGALRTQDVVWGMFCFGNCYGGGYLRMLPKGVRRGVVNTGGGAIEGPIFEVTH